MLLYQFLKISGRQFGPHSNLSNNNKWANSSVYTSISVPIGNYIHKISMERNWTQSESFWLTLIFNETLMWSSRMISTYSGSIVPVIVVYLSLVILRVNNSSFSWIWNNLWSKLPHIPFQWFRSENEFVEFEQTRIRFLNKQPLIDIK